MSNRIAIVNQDKCKPTKCRKECINNCPPQSNGKEVIKIIDFSISDISDISDIEDLSKNIAKNKVEYGNIKDVKKIAKIVEKQCIGCNICVKKCPFGAISIVNLPFEKKEDIIHRYGYNGFRLYRLPDLKKNIVTGIIGENGVGKSTLINILSKNIIPNFEDNNELDYKQIIGKFRGSVLYDYLKQLYTNKLKVSIKPQKIKQKHEVSVENFIKTNLNINLNEEKDQVLEQLELSNLLQSNVSNLSGGETQRLLCYITLNSDADVYIFDEPSNYLDIKQRLIITKLIRQLIQFDKYVIVIDHDMSMLDLVADELLILYGKPSAYGIVSNPMTTLEGINIYLDGYIPSENVRFREEEFNLKTTIELDSIHQSQIEKISSTLIDYSSTTIEYPGYKLIIPEDKIDLNSTINVIMGENGNGKSTFIKYIAKTLGVPISYKDQTLGIKKYAKNGVYPTVNQLFYDNIHLSYTDAKFINEVVRPLNIIDIQDRQLDKLSGGELQKVLLILCLGTPASIYLIDEPSSNMDIEKRLTVIKVIKRYILNNNKCAFIIEHDIMMAVSFAQEFTSRILLIDKKYNKEEDKRVCTVSSYLGFKEGITTFLKSLDITMRVASHNRPRINKYNSQLDREQKLTECYYS